MAIASQGIVVCDKDFLAWEEKKDPSAEKFYVFDLTGYLGTANITVVNSVIAEAGSSLTIGDGANGMPQPFSDGKRIQFWVKDGIVGNWEIEASFDVDNGVIDQHTRVLQVAET